MLENSYSTQNSKLYNCNQCDYICNHISNFNKHLLTKKHQNNCEELNCDENSNSIKNPKSIQTPQNYRCEYCNFFTKKPSAFSKHVNTIKHKEKINPTIENENAIKYNCKRCEKEYSKKNSCSKHEKMCILQNSVIETELGFGVIPFLNV
jgi:hypothetical protein